MTEKKKEELCFRITGWAKQGGKLRRLSAFAALILLLAYYHGIGRHMTAKRRKSARHKKGYRLLKAALLMSMTFFLFLALRECYLSIEHRKKQERLKAVLAAEEDVIAKGVEPLKEEISPGDVESDMAALLSAGSGQPEEPVMLERFEKLYEENSDLAAWLFIEGMVIDYPVMQCEDDEYYLHHDFDKNEDRYGCLYVRGRADINNGFNFIIYGHNMRDGAMFGDLDLYLDESFYPGHSMISFDTLYEERTYEIISVFRSQIYNSDDDVFKYYQFYEADTEEEFDYFYENIKALSLYDTGVTAEFGDTFLTLSTCAYHVDDGRFAIVAKRCQ
ncbi:MAG: class B sortase [Muribaculaceae bacterium]|nr:class B sortase [Muribaculaceae bacterium]